MSTNGYTTIKKVDKILECVGVFTFDISIGQKCECLYPESRLAADDLTAIAKLSFPDSHSMLSSRNAECVYAYSYIALSTSSRVAGSVNSGKRGAPLSCYVYFRQVEDRTSSRGFCQKSFVIMSSSSGSFSNASELFGFVRAVGKKFFLAEEAGRGREVIEEAYSYSDQCRSPSSASLFRRTSSLSTRSMDLALPTSPVGNSEDHAVDELFTLVEGFWHVWEALVVGIPILVYAPGSAEVCSKAVIALLKLIEPLEYKGAVRPLLSVCDADYSDFRKSPPACIVGVTNPLAVSQLSGVFPLVVALDDRRTFDFAVMTKVASCSSAGAIYVADSISSISSGTRSRVASLTVRPADSGYRLSIPSDFPNRKLEGGRKSVLKYFSSLTTDFLLPFLPFLEADWSGLKLDPLASTPGVLPLHPPVFLSSGFPVVGLFGSTISRVKAELLYAQFLRTVTFRDWIAQCQAEANHDVITHQCEAVVKWVTRDRLVWLSPADRERASLRIAELQHSLLTLDRHEFALHAQLNAAIDLLTQ